ncbi:transcription repressor OFP7-like [Salvia hispanica]|uniref:transcription repressor OFP7-like n=1 Tax=Salvia hispanica TaxID=49212 RepID=UPI002009D9FA|nr:transcription repressor OFP7-like [Salvia hispanica]
MAKRFKLRIYRAIATTLQSCRSKDPSTLPKDPSTLPKDPSTLPKDPVPPFSHSQPPQFKWQKEDKWHVVAKIPTPPPPEKTRRRAKKKRNLPARIRLSTSSADSGWFSSEGAAEETETLVSSSPASSSSLHPIRETQPFPNSNPRNPPRRSRRSRRAPAREMETTPARLSVFKKLIPCTVEGKVKESFAIVKRSENPLEDFKKSMMDMIVEKQMFDKKDLEQLLHCFLSLNSSNYHGIIVEAFSQIWTAMFAPPLDHSQRRRVSRVASS